MTRKAITSLALIVCAFVGVAAPARAHQQRVALTTVLFNDRTGNIEVMHRLYVHDAEHAARNFWGTADLLDNAADQKRFGDYVRARFTLKTPDNETLELAPVGQEADGPYLWVYEETFIPDNLEGLVIDNRILRDLWSDQANLVNVEKGEFRDSLLFHDGAGELSIRLVPDNPN
ncbi:MAG: DUF6702 family protein [Parvularculaceae bacterium]